MVVPQSVMPPFPWLFEERAAEPSETVVNGKYVANRDGLDLIEYLLSMNRTYPAR
jgi:cytochrome c oxidase cbb3-type subunit 2